MLLILVVAGFITQAIHEGKKTAHQRWAGTGARWADAIAPGNQVTGWGRRGARLARGVVWVGRVARRGGRGLGAVLGAAMRGAGQGVRQGIVAWKAWRADGGSRREAWESFRNRNKPPADGPTGSGSGEPGPDPSDPDGGADGDAGPGDGPTAAEDSPTAPRRACAGCGEDLINIGDDWKHRGGTCPSTPALTAGPADTIKGDSMSDIEGVGDGVTHEQAKMAVATAQELADGLRNGIEALEAALRGRDMTDANVLEALAIAQEACDTAWAAIGRIDEAFITGGHDDVAEAAAGRELAESSYYSGV